MYLIKLLLWEILGGGGRVLQDSWNNLIIFSFHLVPYTRKRPYPVMSVKERKDINPVFTVQTQTLVFSLSLSQSLGTRAIWMTSEWAASILQNTKEAAMDAKVRGNVTRNENKCNTENQSLLSSKRNGDFVFPYLSLVYPPLQHPPPLLPRLTQNNANTRNRIMLQQIFPRKYPSVGNQCKSIYMYIYLEIKTKSGYIHVVVGFIF